MSSCCRPDRHQRVRAAARALDADPRVLGTDVLAPREDPTASWTLEATLRPRAGGLPPGLAAELACRGLTARCRERNGYWLVVATV